MALTIYATAANLDEWIDGDAPDNADTLLRSATFLVGLACQRNPFGDVPSDADAEVLAAATCAQSASWIGAGIDPATLAIAAPLVKKSSILGADVEVDTARQLDAQQAAIAKLCPESLAILTAAELLWLPTAHGDDNPGLPTYGLSGAPLGVSTTWANSTDAWPFL